MKIKLICEWKDLVDRSNTSGPGRLPSPTQKCASGAWKSFLQKLFGETLFSITCPLYVKLGMRKVCASTTTTLVMRQFHSRSSFHHGVIRGIPVIRLHGDKILQEAKRWRVDTHLSDETSWMPLKARIFCGLGYRSCRGILTSPKFTPNASHQTDSQRMVRRVFPPGRVNTMSSLL